MNLVIIGIISAAVLILTPFYVLAQKDGACPKSLTLKMICATGYMAVGLINYANAGSFYKFMLCALIASYVGDLFLHIWKPKWFKAIGFLGFLTAHVFFIIAFYSGICAESKKAFFVPIELLFIAIFDIFFVVFSKKTGMKLSPALAVPIILYATVITTMMCKAWEFGISAFTSGADNGLTVIIFCILGSTCFVASDFTISMLMFNDRFKKNIPLKMFNMITYFIAELSLAFLITIG